MSGPTFSSPMRPEDSARALESEGQLVGDGSIREVADGPGSDDAASVSPAAMSAEAAAAATLGRRRWPLPKLADPNLGEHLG